MAIVEAKGLTKVYGSGTTEVIALDHVDLAVDAGEFVAVMGPSGCGKSTLLNLLGGLDTPTEGEIEIDGVAVSGMTDDELTMLRRRRFGFVFQFFNLIPVLNATENAALPLTLDGVPTAESHKRAEEWLVQGGSGRPPAQPAGPTLRRRAAARRRGTGARHRPRAPARRRAHRQPRQPLERGDCAACSRRRPASGAGRSSWSRTTRASQLTRTVSCS